jgi:hypothetical protein
MLAELILVRLAVALENTLSQGVYRVGARHELPDGSFANTLYPPSLLITSERRLKAGRSKIGWLDASDVCDALKAVLDPTDKTITNLRNHGLVLSQIRKVRNHIAHKNRTSLMHFQTVVSAVYGAKLYGVTPGQLLLTPRAGAQTLLEKLLVGSRIAVRATFSA